MEAIHTLLKTDLKVGRLKNFYRGKVRDLYHLENNLLIMVATDRVSAFDTVMEFGIPFKGQVLNQLSTQMIKTIKGEVPNWFIDCPDPNVSVGKYCTPIPIEMVIRRYLVGHIFRLYSKGERKICEIEIPDGLKQYDRLESPIITPTTKSHSGHDLDISKGEILSRRLVSSTEYEVMENYTYKLFDIGTSTAEKRGLVLMDTKYEFGKDKDGQIVLIDEVHTADSSRYIHNHGYEKHHQNPKHVKHLSKEFFRQWLISEGFQGKEGQILPVIGHEVQNQLSKRYIELFEILTDRQFVTSDLNEIHNRIQNNINSFLNLH